MFHLRREVDGQPLGIILSPGGNGGGSSAEVREIVPGAPAAQRGMTAKVRGVIADGSGQAPSVGQGSAAAATTPLVPWVVTEINGRPLNLFCKDGEAADRLGAVGRDASVLVQPADFVHRLRKQLKSHVKGHKDYVMN